MPGLVPTIEELEQSLDAYRDRLARAPYIDNTAEYFRERDECQQRIAEIKVDLASLAMSTAS